MTWKTTVRTFVALAMVGGIAAACDSSSTGPSAGEKQVSISFRDASTVNASAASLTGGAVSVSEAPITFTSGTNTLTLDNLALTVHNLRLDCADDAASGGDDSADTDTDTDSEADTDTDNDDADTDTDSDADTDTDMDSDDGDETDDVPLRIKSGTITLNAQNQLTFNGTLPAGTTCTSFDALKLIARDLTFSYSLNGSTPRTLTLKVNMPLNVDFATPLTFTTDQGSITLAYDMTQVAAAIQAWITANPTEIQNLSSAKNEHQLVAMLKKQLRSFLHSM